MRASFFSSNGQQEGLDISVTVVPPVSSVPSQGRQPPEIGAQTDEVTGFEAEGVAVDEKSSDSRRSDHGVDDRRPICEDGR